MTAADLRELLQQRATFGSWCTLSDPIAAEAMATGMDWVLLDGQHGSFSEADFPRLIHAVEAAGAAAVLRVGGTDPRLLMKAADLGVAGVVIPLVESAEQAARAISAVRFPPEGTRSYGPMRPTAHPSRQPPGPLCLPMVESVAGLKNLEHIAATPGIDGILVGAVDLGLSMGLGVCPGDQQPEELQAAVRTVIDACNRHNICSAGVAVDAADGLRLRGLGMRLISVVADRGLLAAGVARAAQALTQPPTPGGNA